MRSIAAEAPGDGGAQGLLAQVGIEEARSAVASAPGDQPAPPVPSSRDDNPIATPPETPVSPLGREPFSATL